MSRVPGCVIKELVSKAIHELREERKQLNEKCTQKLNLLDSQKV